ncbi:MAG TPA: hypothetical protein VFS23_31410 [Vicinamibacterales bacterium]|nr:hypothetical protein [Vicinamibacterales bacterium]
MTSHTAVIPGVDGDIRWREWQARGDANDRRTSARMRTVALLVVAAWMGWFVIQLT